MKIALDFDDTYTAHPQMWDDFIDMAKGYGHEVKIVTFRKSSMEDPCFDYLRLQKELNIVFTEYTPKRAYCKMIGWEPDIWIDDSPEFIVSG